MIVDYLMNARFRLFLLKMRNLDTAICLCILLQFVSKTGLEGGKGERSLWLSDKKLLRYRYLYFLVYILFFGLPKSLATTWNLLDTLLIMVNIKLWWYFSMIWTSYKLTWWNYAPDVLWIDQCWTVWENRCLVLLVRHQSFALNQWFTPIGFFVSLGKSFQAPVSSVLKPCFFRYGVIIVWIGWKSSTKSSVS